MNSRIPMLEALRVHLERNPLPLHVPGHKMGRGFPPEAAIWIGQALRLDLTELPGLDDLHQPTGPILEAQRLAAETFGSEETYFLVGGSTVGNMAMIFTACRPGESIIIPRNAHKSVHNAIMLAGARPIYIYPEVDEKFGIPTEITVEEVKRALAEYPDARAVLLTSPTYQGVCSDIAGIAKVVHERDKLLLVDEAHGAHFSFHEKLPASAIRLGADLVVQSTHKMLGSLTGTAMLHGNHGRYDAERLRTMLAMLQTSSPSYLMLLSLDAVRHEMAVNGRELLNLALEALHAGRNEANRLAGLELYEGNGISSGVDPFKWWIQVERLGLTGFAAERILREQQGIFFEMADERHLLAVFTFADTDKQVGRLLQSLRYLSELRTSEATEANRIREKHRYVIPYSHFRLEQVALPKDALHGSCRRVKLETAAGAIAAEPVIPYPPGIPLILPGERYTPDLTEYIQEMKELGARFQGTEDPTLEYVRVLE